MTTIQDVEITTSAAERTNEKGFSIKIRYVQIALLFFLMVISFAIRGILSVAIVAMTTNGTSSNPNVPVYHWNNTNIVLSSFFWSYAIIQFFAGHMAQMYGTKWFLTMSVFFNATCSIAVPIFADTFGSNGVMACRIIQGLFRGFLLPLTQSMLGRWAPLDENSWMSTTVYAGCAVGGIISHVITGYLSASEWGWPSAYYFFGILGYIWCIFWIVLSANTPAAHKSISADERKYIEVSLSQENDHLVDTIKIPWKAIFTSVPYWACIIGAVGESWGSTLLSTELPTYLTNVVGLDITQSSWFSSAPIFGMIAFGLCGGPTADFLINKGYTSRVTSRRIFHAIGTFIPAATLVFLSYLEDKYAIGALLMICYSAQGFMTLGFWVNHIDISPRYSGILTGISNGSGQMVAIMAPMMVHFIVARDESNKTLWRSIFIMAALIYVATSIVFIIFVKAERQWWDSISLTTEAQKNKGKDLKIEEIREMDENGEVNQAFQCNNEKMC